MMKLSDADGNGVLDAEEVGALLEAMADLTTAVRTKERSRSPEKRGSGQVVAGARVVTAEVAETARQFASAAEQSLWPLSTGQSVEETVAAAVRSAKVQFESQRAAGSGSPADRNGGAGQRRSWQDRTHEQNGGYRSHG